MDERRAIERLKGGDIGGLEVLVRMHNTRAVRTVDLIVHDTGLAQEIVQSAFVRVYERIGRFDESRSFGPYFTRIVFNDAIKAASRRVPGAADPWPEIRESLVGSEAVAGPRSSRRFRLVPRTRVGVGFRGAGDAVIRNGSVCRFRNSL